MLVNIKRNGYIYIIYLQSQGRSGNVKLKLICNFSPKKKRYFVNTKKEKKIK